jgi:hypothetical protein
VERTAAGEDASDHVFREQKLFHMRSFADGLDAPHAAWRGTAHSIIA